MKVWKWPMCGRCSVRRASCNCKRRCGGICMGADVDQEVRVAASRSGYELLSFGSSDPNQDPYCLPHHVWLPHHFWLPHHSRPPHHSPTAAKSAWGASAWLGLNKYRSINYLVPGSMNHLVPGSSNLDRLLPHHVIRFAGSHIHTSTPCRVAGSAREAQTRQMLARYKGAMDQVRSGGGCAVVRMLTVMAGVLWCACTR